MFKFNSLTNVRPTKDLGTKIVASSTPGGFKITPDAAKVLDVQVEDFLQLVESEGEFYAVKGEHGVGGKIGASSKVGGGNLSFSGAKAWDDMGGDSDFNTMFDIDSENPVEFEGRKFFKLIPAGKEPKQERKTKASKAEGTVSDSAADERAVEAVEVEEDMSFDDM